MAMQSGTMELIKNLLNRVAIFPSEKIFVISLCFL